MDLIDLTKLIPPEPPETCRESRLIQRLNDRRRAEYEATCRAITLPPMPDMAKRSPEWIARRRPKRRSQFRGIVWKRDVQKWEATIYVRFNRLVVGQYDDEVDAARARDAAMDRNGMTGRRNLPPLREDTT